ncbi:ATP-binding cassette domain-containing protein [Candidatus Lucifugimonas marina]|uniref:ATP-binding cassette domain-containing protein n=1 Tax=Candidatus Lucifugimonas marina TaxID=3038979 RepID=A0AAJ5ZIR4_9CHLR|nr:ATP-binding cassette domain-containing protein [SAR202 cluster bacterium JH702]MDG0868890.1 ATP-binding cassette domain-containing protein [SAR202 cluster bacterium JH639]WFG35519.1 ATP-binding cassette domain-containing protein [SAR202 cluster bacterium JH545]WFG39466.1 ATP-binding cassette domain-containing protein [SAR202 cluster bacterium JH1073]
MVSLFIPRLLGEGVDDALTLIKGGTASKGEIESLLLNTALLVILVSALRGTTGFAQMFLGETLSQRVSNQLRLLYFDKLQVLSFSFHDRVHTGQLMSRGLSDIEGVRMFVQSGLVQIVRVVVVVVAAGIFMAQIDWQLALLSLGFVPFMVYRSAKLRLQLRTTWRKIQDALGELTTTMQENLAGIRVVRAFSAQKFEESKFDVTAREVVDLRMSAARTHARGGGVISFAFLVAWAVVLWVGGEKVISGELTEGELTQFFFYLALLRFPVRMIIMIINSTARASSAGGRIFEVLDIPSEIADKPDAKPLQITEGVLKFDNVSFSYGDAPALNGISFEARKDHTIGIVGAPGSGKSSITNLIPRFYDPTVGTVSIDGTDLKSATILSIRGAIGLVEQDPFLFDGSIRDNIRYGDINASDEKVVAAATIAQIHDFIDGLPEGYDTELGERGVGLSGGQRQRVAIARTLLTDSPILVLDDSTSSVDAGTDARIRQALSELTKGQTTIIIAHRLGSLQHADEILVLDNGKVVERGSHDDLLALNGHYKHLWDLQRGRGVEESE